MCDFSIEDDIAGRICGVDEVGRGPLAGPVVAAAVIIPQDVRHMNFIAEIKDSKKLSFKKLEALYEQITEHCEYAITEISPQEIDDINILQASLKAMRVSIASLMSSRAQPRDLVKRDSKKPDPSTSEHRSSAQDDSSGLFALIDGNRIPQNMPCPAQSVIKGDGKSKSIAAASIIAKVTRDRIMHELAKDFLHYGWERNVGYPSKAHLESIKIHGITPHHRKSFRPVAEYIEMQQSSHK